VARSLPPRLRARIRSHRFMSWINVASRSIPIIARPSSICATRGSGSDISSGQCWRRDSPLGYGKPDGKVGSAGLRTFVSPDRSVMLFTYEGFFQYIGNHGTSWHCVGFDTLKAHRNRRRCWFYMIDSRRAAHAVQNALSE
jgi:hypothetical protein